MAVLMCVAVWAFLAGVVFGHMGANLNWRLSGESEHNLHRSGGRWFTVVRNGSYDPERCCPVCSRRNVCESNHVALKHPIDKSQVL